MGPHLAIRPFLPKSAQSANNSAAGIAKTRAETKPVCKSGGIGPDEFDFALTASQGDWRLAHSHAVERRAREVDAAVRTALGRYVVSPLPRSKLASWFAMGRLPVLRDEILSAWREQHA